jgi:hypothetical protein
MPGANANAFAGTWKGTVNETQYGSYFNGKSDPVLSSQMDLTLVLTTSGTNQVENVGAILPAPAPVFFTTNGNAATAMPATTDSGFGLYSVTSATLSLISSNQMHVEIRVHVDFSSVPHDMNSASTHDRTLSGTMTRQ